MTHEKALIRINGELERANALEDLDLKIKRLLNIAHQFRALKIDTRAEEVYDRVLEIVQSMLYSYDKISYLINLAEEFEEIKAISKSQKIRNRALELSQTMIDGYEKINILQKLGFLEEAIQMTRQCLNSDRKATTLIDISHLVKQPDRLVSLWQEAIAVAKEIVDVHERDRCLAYPSFVRLRELE